MSFHRSIGLYLAFFACCSALFNANVMAETCSPTTIGSDTATPWTQPLRAYYHDNRTQSIVLAGQLGGAGNITELALNVVTPSSVAMNNWTIRMKHTTNASFTSAYLEGAGWTTVYAVASMPAGTAGWRTFTFTTPFLYDGTSNLMVDFCTKDNLDGTDGTVACFSATDRSVIKGDNGATNPLTWSGISYAYRRNFVPHMIFTICRASGPNLSFSQRTADSVTWSWTRPSTNELGYYGHDPIETLVWTAPAGSSYQEINLVANTQYTRHVHAYDANGPGPASNNASVYTLPVEPDVTCDRQASCPSYANYTSFTFGNAVAFGGGGVDHYHYVWDRNASYAFNGSEAAWASGTIQLTANQLGNWYLHVVSHNPEQASGGSVDFGPFVIASIPGYTPGDLNYDCKVDEADLDVLAGCGSGPGVTQSNPACLAARLDADDDVDSVDFAIFQRCWTGNGFAPVPNCQN